VGTNCGGVAKLPQPTMRGIKKLKNQNLNLDTNRRKPKAFLTVNFSKIDPLYKCRSVPFYREASGLFTYRDYPHVKWIKTECATLIFGSLQLGLHVIGAPWRHATNRGAFFAVSTCAYRENSFLETSLSPGASFHLKHMPQPNLNALDVRGDETPRAKPKLKLAGWVRFASGASSQGKPNHQTMTLTLWTTRFTWLFCWWWKVMAERWVLKDEKGLKGPWGFAAEPFESYLTN
jgi:hypothetical protein